MDNRTNHVLYTDMARVNGPTAMGRESSAEVVGLHIELEGPGAVAKALRMGGE
jgi:hypothetical protein